MHNEFFFYFALLWQPIWACIINICTLHSLHGHWRMSPIFVCHSVSSWGGNPEILSTWDVQAKYQVWYRSVHAVLSYCGLNVHAWLCHSTMWLWYQCPRNMLNHFQTYLQSDRPRKQDRPAYNTVPLQLCFVMISSMIIQLLTAGNQNKATVHRKSVPIKTREQTLQASNKAVMTVNSL